MNAKLYERIELYFPEGADFVNIIGPDGSAKTLKTFKKYNAIFSYDKWGYENISLDEKPTDCFRYTPDMVGDYKLDIVLNQKTIKTIDLHVDPSEEKGYIRVSEKDSEYFEYDDGTPFFAVGINMVYPTSYTHTNGTEFGLSNETRYIGIKQYERWFRECAKNGVNLVRLWLGCDYFTPDTEQIGVFKPESFAKIDEIFNLAHKYNIRLKLTLEQFRYFSYAEKNDFIFNLFSKKLYNGDSPCPDVKEWLNNSLWRDAWLLKVGELAKRYSGDTALFAVELWNETDAVAKLEDIVQWNRAVIPEIKKMFPKHFVTNSIGSLDRENTNKFYHDFCWDICDFSQFHRYLDQGATYSDCNKHIIDMVKGGFKLLEDIKRPLLLAETGAVNDCHSGPFRYYSSDDRGIIFADCVYTPLFLKSCGCGNIWHWDQRYVESKNLYKMFKPLSELIHDVDFTNENFNSVDLSDDDVFLLLLEGQTTTLGYIRNKNDSWMNTLRDISEPDIIKKKEFTTKVSDKIENFPIWNEDTTKLYNSDNTIIAENILYGTLFKITHKTKG